MVCQVQAGASLRVAGSVDDLGGEAAGTDDGVVGEVGVGGLDRGGRHAEPGGLRVHEGEEREVALVVEDGRGGDALELVGSGDVVDVGVGDEDVADGERVAGEAEEDSGDVVAGVDDDGLVRDLVAEDGAVALQRSDGEGLADHAEGLLLGGCGRGRCAVRTA